MINEIENVFIIFLQLLFNYLIDFDVNFLTGNVKVTQFLKTKSAHVEFVSGN